MAVRHLVRQLLGGSGNASASRSVFTAVVTAVAAAVAAMGAGALLDPWLHNGAGLVLALPAIVLCAVWSGVAAGILAAALCTAGYLLPLPITGSHSGADALLVFVVGVACAIIAGTLAKRARARSAGEPLALSSSDEATLYWLRAAVLLAVLIPWAGFAAVALYTHQATLASGEQRMHRFASVAREHALRLLDISELLLRQADLLTEGLDPAQLGARQGQLSEQLAGLTQGVSAVHSMWVLDASGALVASNRAGGAAEVPSFAGGPVFMQHRDRPGGTLVARAQQNTAAQESYLQVSRRRQAPDGTFRGVTVVGLQPAFFTEFYRELAGAEPGTVLTMVHADGGIITRWPEVPQGSRMNASRSLMAAIRKNAQSGAVRGVSPFDGKERVGGFNRVGNYPLYAYAALDRGSALADWHLQVLALAGFILPLSLSLAFISWQALRRTRQHITAAVLLQKESGERQKVEAALRQAQKVEAMGHLTGGVAHDFNNMLMVVNLNVSLLRARLGGLHDKQLEALERAVGNGKKLTRQLLAFSRRQPLMPRVLDFAATLPRLLETMQPLLGSGIALTSAVETDTRQVSVDMAELELALRNLAINAREAMPEGGELHVHARNDGAGMVELSLRDTGCGIAPEDLEKVFDPFFTTKAAGSFGLGLSQVHSFCTRAGGTARIESTPGVGTTVFLLFPARETEAPRLKAAPVPTPSLPALALRVLMVEDNPDVASATRDLLEMAGCEVVHVTQPLEALQHLGGDARFDVVLSDIVMPGGMDGIEFAAELEQLHPRLPVVLMTGYAQKLHQAERRRLIVLPKPFDPGVLMRKLAEAAHRGRSDVG